MSNVREVSRHKQLVTVLDDVYGGHAQQDQVSSEGMTRRVLKTDRPQEAESEHPRCATRQAKQETFPAIHHPARGLYR